MTQSIDESFERAHTPIWRRERWWFAGVVAGIAATATLYTIVGRGRVARQLAAIRARGEPTNMEELESYAALPQDGQDATQFWLRGMKLLWLNADRASTSNLPLFSERDLPTLGQPWPDVDLCKQFLQANADGLAALHDAAALGGPVHYSVNFNEQVDAAQWQRHAGRCLVLEAHARAHDGDYHGAALSLRAGLLLSNSLSNVPTSISQLIRMPLYGMTIAELKRIGPVNLPADDLRQLQGTLAQIEFSSAVKRVSVGECAYGISMFDDPGSVGLPKHLQYLSVVSRSFDLSLFLQLTEELVEVSELPWPSRTGAMNEWAVRAHAQATVVTPLTQQLLPIFPMLHTLLARVETENRLAIVDVAIARYQQKHGRPPESLAELVPEFLAEVPTEPTTLTPFIYRANDASHLLYCTNEIGSAVSLVQMDPETGVNPQWVFRWPPLPETPAPEQEEVAP